MSVYVAAARPVTAEGDRWELTVESDPPVRLLVASGDTVDWWAALLAAGWLQGPPVGCPLGPEVNGWQDTGEGFLASTVTPESEHRISSSGVDGTEGPAGPGPGPGPA